MGFKKTTRKLDFADLAMATYMDAINTKNFSEILKSPVWRVFQTSRQDELKKLFSHSAVLLGHGSLP